MPKQEARITIKQARIRAIQAATGVLLSENITSKEVKKYVTQHIYASPQWRIYYEIFATLRAERGKMTYDFTRSL